MKLKIIFQLVIVLVTSVAVFVGCVNQPGKPAIAPTKTAPQPPPFAEVVKKYFSHWDKNGDGILSKDEMDAVVVNPACHGEEAAAIAAIKLVVRGGKYTLPPITQAYLVASPLRETNSTNTPPAGLDDPAQPKQTGHAPAFQPRYRFALTRLHRVSRELFPQSQPLLDACHQGPLGDCYFVSVVGGMLDRNPADVKAMFHPNRDGSTTVAFANGHSVKVPPLTDAEIAISSIAGTNGLWLTVLENAFGKFRQAALPANPEAEPDTDAIAHGGKPGYVITALDGYKTKAYTLQLTNGLHHTAQYSTNLMADLSAALQNHRLAEASTPTNSLPPGINQKHAYAILGYNRETGTVRLWNPHGNNFKPKGPDGLKYGYATKAGQFDLPLKDLLAIYKSVIIETPNKAEP
jgi:hypothetical protein